jgi:tRNA pseudouridine32 synthase/23S rRNA pseudouridine746 synthase
MQACRPSLVLQHNDLIIVNKPANVQFHHVNANASRGEGEGAGVLHQLRELQAEGALPRCELYPVHRLDAVTSGLLAFATSPAAARQLAEQFRQRQVHKYYVALSARPPRRKMGTVSGDMAPSRRGAHKLLRSTEDPAVTRFWSTGLPSVRTGMRLYILKPVTGRTHQLRVAMKSNGAPILGDALYSAADEARAEQRAYLHAAALRLVLGGELVQAVCHPAQGEHFLHAGCREALRQALPEALQLEPGAWFAGNKLLASDPAGALGGGGGGGGGGG